MISDREMYRRRMYFTAFIAALGAGSVVGLWDWNSVPKLSLHNALMLTPGSMLLIAAVLLWRIARSSLALDLGHAGPSAYRALVMEASKWATNGYRTPEEIAAGVPPRSRPPNQQ